MSEKEKHDLQCYDYIYAYTLLSALFITQEVPVGEFWGTGTYEREEKKITFIIKHCMHTITFA